MWILISLPLENAEHVDVERVISNEYCGQEHKSDVPGHVGNHPLLSTRGLMGRCGILLEHGKSHTGHTVDPGPGSDFNRLLASISTMFWIVIKSSFPMASQRQVGFSCFTTDWMPPPDSFQLHLIL